MKIIKICYLCYINIVKVVQVSGRNSFLYVPACEKDKTLSGYTHITPHLNISYISIAPLLIALLVSPYFFLLFLLSSAVRSFFFFFFFFFIAPHLAGVLRFFFFFFFFFSFYNNFFILYPNHFFLSIYIAFLRIVKRFFHKTYFLFWCGLFFFIFVSCVFSLFF